MQSIVVVEDNDEIRESVVMYFKLDDYRVYEFPGVRGVMELLSRKHVDCLILDVMLPDGNGFALAKDIRTLYATPIIFLTAKDLESDKITGFEIGADDYVVKPFSPKELLLRVKSILKRVSPGKATTGRIVRYAYTTAILCIDYNQHSIQVNDMAVKFTQSEWEILHYLASHAGSVLSRSQILNESLGYTGIGVERTIDAHIKKIRKKLGSLEWISTIRGYGYKFNGTRL
jgi:DNA-binding response OmpR family regulator